MEYPGDMWKAEEHTADACLYVEAATWIELLEEAVRAFAEWVHAGELGPASSGEERAITVEGADATGTWVRFWRALHRLWVVEGVLPTHASVDPASDERTVKAAVSGCPVTEIDPGSLEDVKAVTWHGAEIGRDADRWYGRIVLDI